MSVCVGVCVGVCVCRGVGEHRCMCAVCASACV